MTGRASSVTAAVDAVQFRKLLEGRRVATPAPLLDAYPDALKGYARARVGGRAVA
ncbi:MAG TPA: hypothetical protein VK912_07490 [Longimicrobiales bacterium]|nr:hypothetical protein [Longimicrobiales bacterium]